MQSGERSSVVEKVACLSTALAAPRTELIRLQNLLFELQPLTFITAGGRHGDPSR